MIKIARALVLLAGILAAAPAFAADAPDVKSYPAADARALVLETDGGPITLTASDDKTLTVQVSPAAAAGDDCRIAQDLRGGGTLTLTAHGERSFFGSAKPCSAGFNVSAPAGVVITARSGSGKIDVGAFKGKADIRAGSGAIELHGPSGDLALRSGSGTVSGDAGGQKNIDVETGSGGIDLRELTGSIAARSGSGFVSLAWAGTPRDGVIDVRTGSGDFTAILPAGAKPMLSLKSGSGKLSSEFGGEASAPLSLTFRSGSGSAAIKKKL